MTVGYSVVVMVGVEYSWKAIVATVSPGLIWKGFEELL